MQSQPRKITGNNASKAGAAQPATGKATKKAGDQTKSTDSVGRGQGQVKSGKSQPSSSKAAPPPSTARKTKTEGAAKPTTGNSSKVTGSSLKHQQTGSKAPGTKESVPSSTSPAAAAADTADPPAQPLPPTVYLCVGHVTGQCRSGPFCQDYHPLQPDPSAPFQWQWMADGSTEWKDFARSMNSEIESQFCDAQVDSCHVEADEDKSKSVSITADFVAMRFTTASPTDSGGSQSTIKGGIRRLEVNPAAATGVGDAQLVTVWRWYWNQKSMWQAFECRSSDVASTQFVATEDIESRFMTSPTGQFSFTHELSETTYLFDFARMTQVNTRTSTKRVIRRRPVKAKQAAAASTAASSGTETDCTLPSNWDLSLSPDNDYHRVQVLNQGKTAVEFAEISSLFMRTMVNCEIKSIFRIQNRYLWSMYDRCRARIQAKSSKNGGTPITSRLFHGTARGNLDVICRDGFDFRISGVHGTSYGKGSYFARDASYSRGYTTLNDVMFVVQVAHGEYCAGAANLVRPPPKDPSKPNDDLYDSCVDDVCNPSIFVTFDRYQSYPEYLIEYTQNVPQDDWMYQSSG